MIFAQGFGQDNVAYQVVEICKDHPGCEGCPLKKQDIQVNGNLIRCDSGRQEQQ